MDERYVAGLFDADGWVRAFQNKAGSWVIEAGIANCYLPVLKHLKERWKGGIYAMGRASDRHRRLYQWKVASDAANRFLGDIGDFTIVKKKQILLAVTLQQSIAQWRYKLGNQYKKHPLRDRVMARRKRLAEKIKELKHERFDL